MAERFNQYRGVNLHEKRPVGRPRACTHGDEDVVYRQQEKKGRMYRVRYCRACARDKRGQGDSPVVDTTFHFDAVERQYHAQAEENPGLALRTLLYRLIMTQRGITIVDVADHLGVSREALRMQFAQGLRGAQAMRSGVERFDKESLNELDILDRAKGRRPWLDLVEDAITTISEERGFEFPDESIRPTFQALLTGGKKESVTDGNPVVRFPK